MRDAAVASDLPVLRRSAATSSGVGRGRRPSAFAAACARVLAGKSDEAARAPHPARGALHLGRAAAATLDLWRIALDRFHL